MLDLAASLLGIGLVLATIGAMFLNYISKTWPHVVGVVIDSGTGERQIEKYNAVNHLTRIEVRYSVNGQTYTCRSRSLIEEKVFRDKVTASRIITRYQPGNQIKVFYCRFFPRLSLLEPGTHYVQGYVLLIGAGLLLVVLVAVKATWKQWL